MTGELNPDEAGEVPPPNAPEPTGSMSSEVRNESSARPVAVEVRARKRSRRVFCSARRTPWKRRSRCSGSGMREKDRE